MKFTTKLRPLVVATSLAVSAAAVPMAAHADLSGNIGVYSQYVLRGITNAPEDPNAALQGGFDWSAPSGVYVGYWGSSLGYSSKAGDGFENDIYGGYAGTVGDFSYDLGAIYYAYVNVDDSDAFEITGRAGWGPVTLGLNYLTKDVAWGNQGDIYWTAAFDYGLPMDFAFNATLGYYTYKKNGEFLPETPDSESGAFRHLNLGLSHPIGKTGADMGVTYIIGGKDRYGVDQDNAMVFNVSYNFDIK
jgi:uncharacterized protein (TIGR02001 family)